MQRCPSLRHAIDASMTSRGCRAAFHAVDASQVFFESGTCRALVNLKPLVAGHVLVVPKAVVPTLGEMDEELHRDLWRAARRVHAMITEEYGATGANVAVQDGIAAGQSVPHAHVHVLPRH